MTFTWRSLPASALLAVPLLAGCAWTDHAGTTHVLVLGLGIVSRGQTNGVNAFDLRAAGLVLDRGVQLGLVQSHEVQIDPNQASNVVVSIHANPLSLSVKNFSLTQTNPPPSSNPTP